jgi:AcrR family transcriptional regulator
MVQKEGAKPKRGRPRAYDPDAAITRAIGTFWKAGYSATSLDDLSQALGMNRPSLYAAFGDKEALYRKALEHYWQLGYDAMREALAYDRPIREALFRVYERALSFYFPPKGEPRGCFAIGTATSEAVTHPQIRATLREGLRELDRAFEARLRAAKARGEVSRKSDPRALALLASATLHTIAIRSRAGESRAALEALARSAVGMICAK